MQDKKCTQHSYPFSKTLNNPAVFITNSKKRERGSSLYFVHENGTIRCSGSNEGKRKATTFIRPYLVGYITSKKPVIFNVPAIGLFPFEGRAKNYHELLQIKKLGYGHKGNIITEVISFESLINPRFIPLSWQGSEKGGTDWNIARQEVLDALSNIRLKNGDFKKEEHHVEDPEFKKSLI
ncbi:MULTISPECIES: hypothetical protein [Legionella]|uniref:Uncharacterized protein n=1 Tax=Legionella steelei TaxID=947033 RepID=A0A0W0ZIX1_9GAMM|nr:MULTISPECIES: hypothetical protein [Legionella]KTD68691.1 hypothetical protein Lste_1849 [Legionella steelei]MBN9226722.1 hypothetical protein [Legionella steelei]OJW06724.1 MAG: hypothetical protein BGO44_18215 [Legionella sp. 39-23]